MGFKKGQSGNPSGRPKGARNKTLLALEALLDGEAEELTRRAIGLAKEGDMAALKLCMERIYPPRKDRPVSIDLPPIETANDITKGYSAVMDAVADGAITPSEANTLAGVLESKRRSIETAELADRITELENR